MWDLEGKWLMPKATGLGHSKAQVETRASYPRCHHPDTELLQLLTHQLVLLSHREDTVALGGVTH